MNELILLPSMHSRRSAPRILVHEPLIAGSGLRKVKLRAMIGQHRKVLIFTSLSMVRVLAQDLTHVGVPVIGLTGDVPATARGEAIEAFNTATEGVLVANHYMMRTGWRVNATCIILCEIVMPRRSPEILQMITRAHAAEVHFINCYFPEDTVKSVVEFLDGRCLSSTSAATEVTVTQETK